MAIEQSPRLPPETAAYIAAKQAEEKSYIGVDVSEKRRLRDELDIYIAALHLKGGWTLTAIAEALNSTREWARQRMLRGLEATETVDSVDVPLYLRPPVPPKRIKPTLTEDQIQDLLGLYRMARGCNGGSPLGSPEREASEALTSLLASYIDDDKVGIATIARQTGIQVGTIHSRLRRHGYRKLPPSQKPYLGRPHYLERREKVE